VVLRQDVVSLPHLEVVDTTGLKFSVVGPGRRCDSTCGDYKKQFVDSGNGELEDDQRIEKVCKRTPKVRLTMVLLVFAVKLVSCYTRSVVNDVGIRTTLQTKHLLQLPLLRLQTNRQFHIPLQLINSSYA
jgi:hypothetical protein